MYNTKLRSACLLAILSLIQETVQAAQIEEIDVTGKPTDSRLQLDSMADQMRKAGVNFYQSGGLAALPVINGLNDDRIRVTLDGASVTSSCANHMNPVLSYVDFNAIANVDVIAGITPVSVGGDSIAGTITLQSAPFLFLEQSNDPRVEGRLNYDYGSNGNSRRVSLQFGLRQENFSLHYNGFTEQSDSYEDGNGALVLDTLYRAENHTITAAFRGDNQQLSVKFGHQEVPYQGFPNQYMDMVANDSNSLNVNHEREFNWGTLYSQAAWQKVNHEMGFFTPEKTGTMPMITEGTDINYSFKADVDLATNHVLSLGHEFYRFTLDDYWPAVPGSMMMGPQDFVNIADGERDRIALFAESDYVFSDRFSLVSGVRVEEVSTDAGQVQAYNPMLISMMGMPNADAVAAQSFNARSHKQREINVDLSLLAHYTFSNSFSLELGYARKNRSPNLYERYSWGRGTMAMTMLGWYGDANGYVGDIDLEAETADTLGARLSWSDASSGVWHVDVSPYYTKVDQYIDAQSIGSFNPQMAMNVSRPLLQFTNLDATLYGVRVDAHRHLGESDRWGMWDISASFDAQRGSRDLDNSDLYQIMPLQTALALEHNLGNLQQRLSVEWLDNKSRVDLRRQEPETPAYTLLNWQAQYQWQDVSVSVQVSNLLDEWYALPLGGVNYAAWKASDRSGQFQALAGAGRSLNLGLQYNF
tara:strand:+ start:14753 stop:16852 length:2100 start_codon:yes stop_codon:yes gene_type:complete